MNTLPSVSWRERAIAGALAGLPAGLAHAVVNEIDRRSFCYDSDDLLMVTGMFMPSKPTAKRVGFAIHIGLAMAFGAGYAVVLAPRHDRDALIKAVGAGITENTLLWPLVVPLDKHHPYIRNNRIRRFHHPISFLQATLRHVALGIGLGSTYPSILRRLAG